jgi:uncharacterized membrane protein YidH (DUF202 family)
LHFSFLSFFFFFFFFLLCCFFQSAWSGFGSSAELVNFGMLCDVVKRRRSSSMSLSAVFSFETATFLGPANQDIMQLDRIVALKALFAEVTRVDAVLARDATVLEALTQSLLARWQGLVFNLILCVVHEDLTADNALVSLADLKGVLGDLERFCFFAHFNRCGLLWLVSRFAENMVDVSALLVFLEQQQFWKPATLWRSSFDACSGLAHLLHQQPGVGLGESEESHDETKRGKKNRGKKKKLKLKGNRRVVGDSSSGRVEGTVSRRLTFWVRPWLELACKAALLGLNLISTREEASTRIHLDNKNFGRYAKQVKALDPSLVNRSVGLDLLAVTMESLSLTGGKAVVSKACLFNLVDFLVYFASKGNGSFVEEFISSGEFCSVLSGVGGRSDSSAASVVRSENLLPCVRVSSIRSAFFRSDVSVVWDAGLEMADASESSVVSSVSQWCSVGSQGAHPFPYHTVTVTTSEEAIPKDLMELFQSNKCFVSVPDFDEYVTAVALVHSLLQPKPVWLEKLAKDVQRDWVVALHSNHLEQKPGWLTTKNSKGKEEEEDFDDDFAQSVGESLTSAVPLETMGEEMLLLRAKKTEPLIERDAIKEGLKSDPKVVFANERTLLSWLSVATFLAVSSVRFFCQFQHCVLLGLIRKKSLLTTKTSAAVVAGTVMAPFAMLVALYSLARFHLRLVAIRNGTMRMVVDWIGPWSACVDCCC